MESERGQKDRAIEMDKIQPDPQQPRQHFDEERIQELAESIDKQGLLERILVRPVGRDKYMIVHGERRYRACRRLRWKEIPCRVKDLNEEETRDAQLVENLQRDNLSDMELAWDFKKRIKGGADAGGNSGEDRKEPFIRRQKALPPEAVRGKAGKGPER